MASGDRPVTKKNYDDISYQNRQKLIYLIDEEKWTIRAAAEEIGIKLCTAKYILYLYRRHGKIYKKKGSREPARNPDPPQELSQDRETQNQPTYCIMPVAYPLYVFCVGSSEQMPINLVHSMQM